jgi:hypothetical protein
VAPGKWDSFGALVVGTVVVALCIAVLLWWGHHTNLAFKVVGFAI